MKRKIIILMAIVLLSIATLIFIKYHRNQLVILSNVNTKKSSSPKIQITKITNPNYNIVNDKQAFANALIDKAESYFRLNKPELNSVVTAYNIVTSDGSIWGLVSFETSDNIESTEVVCLWGDHGWEPTTIGTMEEVKDNSSSSDLMAKLYEFKAWQKLFSLKETSIIQENFSKIREAFKEDYQKKDYESAQTVSLENINKKTLNYVGETIKITGYVYVINEKYSTTDLLLTDGINYVNVQIYKKTPLKKGDKATFYGIIQGESKKFSIYGKNKTVMSILATN